MNTNTTPPTMTKPVKGFALKQRSGTNLALYLAGVGSAGMVAMPNAEAAVLYHNFGSDLASNSSTGESNDIQLSVDVVSGLSATIGGSAGDITLSPLGGYKTPQNNHGGKFASDTPGGTWVETQPSVRSGFYGYSTPRTLLGADALVLGSIVDAGAAYHRSHTPQQGNHYLGFSHPANDEKHFGWIHYDFEPGTNGRIRLLEGAVESSPGVGIMAGARASVPEPGVVALLALGAAGFVRRWRNHGV